VSVRGREFCVRCPWNPYSIARPAAIYRTFARNSGGTSGSPAVQQAARPVDDTPGIRSWVRFEPFGRFHHLLPSGRVPGRSKHGDSYGFSSVACRPSFVRRASKRHRRITCRPVLLCRPPHHKTLFHDQSPPAGNLAGGRPSGIGLVVRTNARAEHPSQRQSGCPRWLGHHVKLAS